MLHILSARRSQPWRIRLEHPPTLSSLSLSLECVSAKRDVELAGLVLGRTYRKLGKHECSVSGAFTT
jgi:hypothetical protein